MHYTNHLCCVQLLYVHSNPHCFIGFQSTLPHWKPFYFRRNFLGFAEQIMLASSLKHTVLSMLKGILKVQLSYTNMHAT